MMFWEHKVNKYFENELSRSLKLKRGSNTQYPQLTIFQVPAKQYPKVKVNMQNCIDGGRTSIEYEKTRDAGYTLFIHYTKEMKRYVAFATNMDVEAYCTASLPSLYRKRFWIDTQYRVKNNIWLKALSRRSSWVQIPPPSPLCT